MTHKAKKGKRKKQKAGLNKSILDVGMGMLRQAIEYKVIEAGGIFIEVPTRKVKPSQTCPHCRHQHPKTLDERVHQCKVCGFTMDSRLSRSACNDESGHKENYRGLERAGLRPARANVDGDVLSSTANTPKRAGSMRQLGQAKR